LQVSEAEVQIKNNLRPQWADFLVTVAEAEVTLKRCKISMKKTIQDDLSSFSSQVADIRSRTYWRSVLLGILCSWFTSQHVRIPCGI
jgi:hypothetical protein